MLPYDVKHFPLVCYATYSTSLITFEFKQKTERYIKHDTCLKRWAGLQRHTSVHYTNANSFALIVTHIWAGFITGHRCVFVTLLQYTNTRTVLALMSEWRRRVTQKWQNISVWFRKEKTVQLWARHEVAHWHDSDKMSRWLGDQKEREWTGSAAGMIGVNNSPDGILQGRVTKTTTMTF